jgi:hypothetical protein
MNIIWDFVYIKLGKKTTQFGKLSDEATCRGEEESRECEPGHFIVKETKGKQTVIETQHVETQRPPPIQSSRGDTHALS